MGQRGSVVRVGRVYLSGVSTGGYDDKHGRCGSRLGWVECNHASARGKRDQFFATADSREGRCGFLLASLVGLHGVREPRLSLDGEVQRFGRARATVPPTLDEPELRDHEFHRTRVDERKGAQAAFANSDIPEADGTKVGCVTLPHCSL